MRKDSGIGCSPGHPQTRVSNVAVMVGHPKSPTVLVPDRFSHATEAGVQSHLWNCEGLWRKPQEFEALRGGGAAGVVFFLLECKLTQICDMPLPCTNGLWVLATKQLFRSLGEAALETL